MPNWRSRMDFTAESYSELFADDDTLRFVADPGAEYRYSGEGYVLDFMYGVEDNLGYALLTNSANGQRMVEAVERRVFGRKIRR